jgi:hypothetical protein
VAQEKYKKQREKAAANAHSKEEKKEKVKQECASQYTVSLTQGAAGSLLMASEANAHACVRTHWSVLVSPAHSDFSLISILLQQLRQSADNHSLLLYTVIWVNCRDLYG